VTAGSHASAFSDGAAYEAELGQSHRHYIRVKARLLRRLLDRHHPTARTLIDLGCGTGEMAAALIDSPYEVTGVDLSPAMIEYAQQKKIPRSTFLSADAAKTGLPSGAFDAAFATALYHHVPPASRAAVARETMRLVKPGGLAIVFEHNPANPITRRTVRGCAVDKGVHLLPKSETANLLAKAGLAPVDTRYLLFFPRPLSFFSPMERWLGWIPAGGQYVVVARKPAADAVDGRGR
jgi:SAM-dependent methyltransferase